MILRQRLVSGDLKPGEIYSAQALAAELGVSGSPVREAMLTLVNQGLMEPVRNRGFLVVSLSEKDRQDILELRVMLEVPAMVRLAGRAEVAAARAEYQAVADLIVSAAETGDVVEYLEQDRVFHLGLIGMLGNPRLTQAVENLRDQTRLFGLQSLIESGTLTASALEHAEILAAMVSGDQAATEALMSRHLEHVRGDWAG
ncbi:GntR family transcriptional regulator [Streptomyces sp. NPDC048277]|uniref:GntR family transcriptional regulator n=1 Tax=Streptomyces sp. NPDC048277 TaxID=3155027 RepID=UPI00340D5753